jgi:two-component system chemotaxis sensor kinase CheA
MSLDRDKLLEALRASFAAELDEALPRLEADLLALDRGGEAPSEQQERVHRIFRAVHGLKGAARAASFPEVERICHVLEERFGQARETGAVDAALVNQALDALDTLRDPQAPAAPGSRLERVRPELLDRSLALSHELGVAHGRLDGRLEALGEAIAAVLELEGEATAGSRVDLERRLGGLERRLRRLHHGLRQDRRLFGLLQEGLGVELGQSRRVPFELACQGLERVVRDVAAARGKSARLELSAGTLEIDREVVERLQGALLQLVRNAVDHGIEKPAERARAHKPPEGVVRIGAELQGAEVRVTVEDDGAGLDERALQNAARDLGLQAPAAQTEIWRLALRPGLSTAREVTDVSGRGVGLDVVRDRVEAMHGQLRVWSARGKGARFTVIVPVSLATRRALVLRAGGQQFGLLSSSVRRVHRARSAIVGNAGGRGVLLRAEGNPLPLGDVGRTMGLARAGGEERARILELNSDEGEAAVRVDEVLAEEEVLVKGLGPQVKRLRSYTGLGVRPGGRLLPLLSADRLVRATREDPTALAVEAGTEVQAERHRTRVLVADDSLTTRTLERSILEAAGYDVRVASDGAEAWRVLQEQGADVLVSDVEMPGMDGFKLTEAVRGSRRFGELPVVLVTALGSDTDRLRGMEVGADAYLVKSAFDQTLLLKTLSELLGRRS